MVVRKTVTALFCDLDESVELGERLDPESLRRVHTRYFDEMSAVIERHGGTVEKFIGDAVVAIFGIPQVHEDDALRAVRAADELRAGLGALNRELERDFGVRLQIQVGINTGDVVVGRERERGTLATGDAMNVAARLQQAAAPGEILIGAATYALVKDAVTVGPVETSALKGKRKAVEHRRLESVAAGALGIARRLDAPLVGRQDELLALRAAFDRAEANRRAELAILLGPAGIGKSRLAAELIARVSDRATALTGRCLPYGEQITYWPLAQIVREAGDEGALAHLAAQSDEGEAVADRVRGAIRAGGEAGSADETFWAVRRFVEAVAAERPLVLCLEDVHWAEPTFLDLVEYLAGWIQHSPVLLLCLARPELLERAPTWAAPRPHATLVALEPLPDADASALLGDLTHGLPLAAAKRERIAAAAEGNPLFLEQLVALAAEDGTRELEAPPSIQALLAERLDRLPARERAVLERAAVVGKEFLRREVAELSPTDDRGDVGALLISLVRRELLRPATSHPGEDAFRFRHGLIQEATYAATAREVRADLHERFADWLTAQRTERAAEFEELLAYHYEAAFRNLRRLGRSDERTQALAERAGTLLASAGTRALRGEDVPAAVGLLERAAAVVEPSAELLLDLGAALRDAGDLRGAQDRFADAADAAAREQAPHLAARAEIELVYLRLNVDRDADAEQLVAAVEAAMPIFEARRDDVGLAKAWAHLAEAHWRRCAYAAMEEALERGLVHAERTGDERDRTWILGGLARAALVGPRHVADAIARCEAIRRRATGKPALKAVVDAMLGVLRAMSGELAEARESHRRSERTFEELGLGALGASFGMYAAMTELVAGDAARAEAVLRRSQAALDEMGDRSWLATTAAFLARALAEQGRYAEAEDAAETSETATSEDDVATRVLWLGARARALAARGERGAAVVLAREAVALALRTDFVNLQADAYGDLAAVAQGEEARAAIEAAVGLYEAKGNAVGAARAVAAAGAGAAPAG